MNNSKKKQAPDIEGLFQQITGYYYLIPNIRKCLKRILETINCELSIFAGSIYYRSPDGKKIIVTNQSNKYQKFSIEKLSELSEIIFKENYPIIKKTKRVRFNEDLEACIIPIRFESILLGIMILFDDNISLSPDYIIEDSIGAYISAACIGNLLITSKERDLNTHFGFRINHEVSVKKLLEWRIQEIIDSLFTQFINEQNIYKEISEETEKTLIISALKVTDNNQSKAAKFLGINRNTLRKKIKELKIDKIVKGH